MSIFKQDLKRVFTSWKIYAGIAVVIICWLEMLTVEFSTGDIKQFADEYLFLTGKNVGFLPLVFPLLAAFPFAASYLEEKNSGAGRLILTRAKSRRSFAAQRLLSNGIAGGAMIGGGLALMLLLSLIVGSVPDFTAQEYVTENEYANSWLGGLYTQDGYIWYLIINVIEAFLAGAIWANIGMAAAAKFRNSALPPLMGFMIYYIGLTLFQNYLPLATGNSAFKSFSPLTLYDMSGSVRFSLPLFLIGLALYIGIPCVVFRFAVGEDERRGGL